MIHIDGRAVMVVGIAVATYAISEIVPHNPERALVLALGLFVSVLVAVIVSEL